MPVVAIHLHRGGFKGAGDRGPLRKVWLPCAPPPTARSKVNDAGILLNYVVIVYMCICERRFMSIVFNFITCVTLEFFYCRLFSMHVLCFSTNLTLGIRTKDLHSIVRSRRPVVVPIECPRPKTMARPPLPPSN